jgi:hypothetical protein
MKNISFILLLFFITACSKSNGTSKSFSSSDCTSTISYKTDIQPIMNSYCTSCHQPGNAKGGYELTTYSGVTSNTNKVLASMLHNSGSEPMPDNGDQLSDDLLKKMYCWVNQGAKNN